MNFRVLKKKNINIAALSEARLADFAQLRRLMVDTYFSRLAGLRQLREKKESGLLFGKIW